MKIIRFLYFRKSFCLLFYPRKIYYLSNKHFGIEIVCINKGYIFIAYPGDYLEEQTKIQAIESKYELKIGEELEFNVILQKMLEVFEEITNNSPLVSRKCDVGIHLLFSEGVYKAKVSGDVHELLELAKNKEIETNLEITNKIKFNYAPSTDGS